MFCKMYNILLFACTIDNHVATSKDIKHKEYIYVKTFIIDIMKGATKKPIAVLCKRQNKLYYLHMIITFGNDSIIHNTTIFIHDDTKFGISNFQSCNIAYNNFLKKFDSIFTSPTIINNIMTTLEISILNDRICPICDTSNNEAQPALLVWICSGSKLAHKFEMIKKLYYPWAHQNLHIGPVIHIQQMEPSSCSYD